MVKYETFAFLSRSRSSSSSGSSSSRTSSQSKPERRIRQSVRQVLHSRTRNDPSSRVKSAIKEKFYKVKDKIVKPKGTRAVEGPKNSRIRTAFKGKVHDIKDNIKGVFKHKSSTPKSVFIPPKDNSYVTPKSYVTPNPAYNNGVNNPVGPFNQNTPKMSMKDKIKNKAKSFLMGKLAKKIMGSSKNKKGGHNYMAGTYNGYNYRPGQYSNIRGQKCTNWQAQNGMVFGEYICPIEGYNYDATSCCGMPNEQYCCSPSEAAYGGLGGVGGGRPGNAGYNNRYDDRYRSDRNRDQYNDYEYDYDGQYRDRVNRRYKKSTSWGTILIIPLIILFVIILTILFFNCYKNGTYKKLVSSE